MKFNQPTRRSFLSSTLAATLTVGLSTVLEKYMDNIKAPIKLGMIADLHGGFAKDAANRLDSFLSAMAKEECDALVQLGDFAFPNEAHQDFADKFNSANKETIHVVGNHEFDYGLDRKDCMKAWGIPGSYYRRDIAGIRILVLDGNDKGSPTYESGYHSFIGDAQKAWLDKELRSSDKPVIILSHQPLAGAWAVDNSKSMQTTLAEHKSKIIACFNGHSHVDSLVYEQGVPYLHVNSASYFWVGGKARTAFYKDPLYTTVTVDPETATVSVASKSSEWKSKSPEELGYFDRQDAPDKEIVTPQIRSRKIQRQ